MASRCHVESKTLGTVGIMTDVGERKRDRLKPRMA